jgi:hypothetical protein
VRISTVIFSELAHIERIDDSMGAKTMYPIS